MHPRRSNAEISDPASGQTSLRTPLPTDDILQRLGRAARRGLVPGFAARGADAFRVDADAVPFPYELAGTIEREAGGSIVRLRLRRMRRMPAIFAVVLALTVWPGVWLTDSLMATYWGAYGRWSEQMPWLTYAWYLPLTALPIPWMWRSMARKSRAEALGSREKQVAAVAEALGADRAD